MKKRTKRYQLKQKGETFFAFDLKYAQKYFNKGTRRNGAMLAIELHEDADSKLLSNTEIVRRIGDDPGMAGGRWAKCKKVKPGERGVVVAKNVKEFGQDVSIHIPWGLEKEKRGLVLSMYYLI